MLTSNRTFRLLAATAFAVQVAACATIPDRVGPRHVASSAEGYSSFDCNQIRQEMARVGVEAQKVANVQGRLAVQDFVVFGAAVATFWPALILLAGDDKEHELGRLKGQQVALEKVAIEKRCPVAEELARGRSAA
jgi:hypothetical protein